MVLPMNALGLLFALVLVGIGIVLFVLATKNFRRSRQVAATPTTAVAALQPGQAEIVGVAEAGQHAAFTSPFSGREALHLSFVVEEYRRSGKNKSASWCKVDGGEQGVPFLLRDETGLAIIDPADAELHAPENTIYPGGLRERHAGSGIDVTLNGNGGVSLNLDLRRRRVRERIVAPGARLYALGEAREAPRDSPARMMLGSGDARILLSTRTERALLWRLRLTALGWTAGAMAASLAGSLLGHAAWIGTV